MVSLSDAKLLVEQSDKLFSGRENLLSFWQEVAENFYVERADFTNSLIAGTDMASHLTTSEPLKAHASLANTISTVLRPKDKRWFNLTVMDADKKSSDARYWLQDRSGRLYNLMYYRWSNFNRATKEGDADIAAFGNTVVSCEVNWRRNALLFRNWHLRDVVWEERDDCSVGRVDRKWKATADVLVQKFGYENVSDKVKECLTRGKDRYREFDIRHTFIDSDIYMDGYKKRKKKYVSIFYDCDNKHIMEEIETDTPYYCIPRWKTISGSQYAYSPAVVQSLSDARLVQDMMLSLLEAAQKANDPPMAVVGDALNGEANLYAGGMTHIDPDYDERLGEAIRPILSNSSALPFNVEFMDKINRSIGDSHFIGKVGLPPLSGGMSPYEVSQRISDSMRVSLPLIDPLEDEWLGGLCELSFEVAMAGNLLGSINEIPDDLMGEETKFEFINPIKETESRALGNVLSEVVGVLAQLAPLDPSVANILIPKVIARSVVNNIGAPVDWFRSEQEEEDIESQQAEQAMLAQTIAQIQQGAGAAKEVGEAAQAMQGIKG